MNLVNYVSKSEISELKTLLRDIKQATSAVSKVPQLQKAVLTSEE